MHPLTFLIALGVVLLTVAPDARALHFRHSRESVLELIDPETSNATWQTLAAANGAGEFEDGLLVIDAAETHERLTARRFARVLERKYGLRLVLISKVSNMTIPAFDGLIVNAAGAVIANVSMKRTESQFHFRDGYSKINTYNDIGWWVTNLIMHQQDRPSWIDFHSPESRAHFESRVLFLRDLAKIFAVGSGRPTWMLIEFYSRRRLEPWRVEHVARREATWTEYVNRILALDDDVFYDLKATRVRSTELNSCERYLRGLPMVIPPPVPRVIHP